MCCLLGVTCLNIDPVCTFQSYWVSAICLFYVCETQTSYLTWLMSQPKNAIGEVQTQSYLTVQLMLFSCH